MMNHPTKAQLKNFHRASGIRYLVLDVDDIVDCLSLQDLPQLQHMLALYAAHRAAQGQQDDDLDWALRAMTGHGAVTASAPLTPEFIAHAAGLLSQKLSPQPVTEQDAAGNVRVVSTPSPEAAVPTDHPKIKPYLEQLAVDPVGGLQRLREALEA
jgi:hypothetical protein